MGRKPKTTGPTASGNPEAFKQVLTRMGVDGWRALRMLAVEHDITLNAPGHRGLQRSAEEIWQASERRKPAARLMAGTSATPHASEHTRG